MKRILGRIGDIPRLKGMFIPPRRVELVLNRNKNLGRRQLVIDRPENKDRLMIRIKCPKEEQGEDFKNLLIEQFKVALGILPEVEWVNPGQIPEGSKLIVDLRKVQ